MLWRGAHGCVPAHQAGKNKRHSTVRTRKEKSDSRLRVNWLAKVMSLLFQGRVFDSDLVQVVIVLR